MNRRLPTLPPSARACLLSVLIAAACFPLTPSAATQTGTSAPTTATIGTGAEEAPGNVESGEKASAAEPAKDSASIRFHGYHETHANMIMDGSRTFDPHRTVLGLEADLSENILFSFELDFEHAFQDPELEFAEVEGRIADGIYLVGGTLLMPFGALNENHEPPHFYSVERPRFQTDFVPTSWQEVGAGLRATLADGTVRVRAALVNGFNAFDTSEGGMRLKPTIRDMKQKAKFASFRDLAGVARVEWLPTLHVSLGASAFGGGADQQRADSLQMWIAMAEVDARLRFHGLEARLEGGYGAMDGEYFYRRGTDGPALAAADAELAWHWPCAWNPDQDAVPFIRMEYMDADARGSAHTAYLAYTGGLAWYPIPQLALKADFTRFTSRNPRAYLFPSGPRGEMNQINLGIGLMYP
jgi:hypothetical protein